jgi:uncharacterized protein YpuA (DUF1002 family)
VSSKKTKTDQAEEALRKKVDQMYENYGIDPHGSDEEDLTRVYRHYRDNPEQLEDDLKKSKEYSDQFLDEDIL